MRLLGCVVPSAPNFEDKQMAGCCTQCTQSWVQTKGRVLFTVHSAPKLEFKQKAGCCTEFTEVTGWAISQNVRLLGCVVPSAPKLKYKHKAGCCTQYTQTCCTQCTQSWVQTEEHIGVQAIKAECMGRLRVCVCMEAEGQCWCKIQAAQHNKKWLKNCPI